MAAYHPKTNTVTIDEKALSVCSKMGEEEANAYAFLIGHELAHAFQKEVRNQKEATHFLAYDKHYHSSLRTEKVADIQGVFTAYLAGYGLKKAIPVLFEKIYDAYKIDDSKLTNYPSYEERSATAKEVVKVATDLENLFEANKYLIALGRHDLSIYCLEYILEYYQGREIHNNLGISYLVSATDLFFDIEIDKYSFPLEIDESSQLEKIDKSRGSQLNQMQRRLRNSILTESLKYFDQAIELDKDYYSAKLNKATVLNLLQNHAGAFQLLNSSKFNSADKKLEDYRLLFALTLALNGRENEASLILNELRNSNNNAIASVASYNYQILKKQGIENLGSKKTTFPSAVQNISNKCKIEASGKREKIRISADEELYFVRSFDSGNQFYSFNDGFKDLFSIVVDKSIPTKISIADTGSAINSNLSDENVIMSNQGAFIISEDESTLVKIDKKGTVTEIAKFYD